MTPLTPAAVMALAQQAAESPAHLDPVLVQQVCQEWEEQREALTLQGMGKQLTLLQQQRDAALAERDHERLRYDGMRSDRDDWRKRCEDAQAAHELEKTCRERNWNDLKWVRQALDNECRYSEQRNAALTEARRVLKHVLSELKQTSDWGVVDDLQAEIAAVLAQEEK